MATELADDDWLSIGIDLASRIWGNLEVLSRAEYRELAREQWNNPVPGDNVLIVRVQDAHPELRRRN